MTVVLPQPGEVISYSYLWAGTTPGGRKASSRALRRGHEPRRRRETRAVVLPITHTPPGNDTHAMENPACHQGRLGLDDARSWIVRRGQSLHLAGLTSAFRYAAGTHRFLRLSAARFLPWP